MVEIVNARLVDNSLATLRLSSNRILDIATHEFRVSRRGARPLSELFDVASEAADSVFDANEELIVPGMIDAHVHSRDPGLTHKETWQTLARGAYKGGVVAVCDMPNTIPATLTREAVVAKAKIAKASGLDFGLFLGVGASNISQLTELLGDDSLPLCGVKIFYGQSTGELMYSDLEALDRSLPHGSGRMLVFHSEDQCAIDDNAKRIHCDECTTYASFGVHSKIRSSASAHASTRAILNWAKGCGRHIHIAHISTPLEVELLVEARAQGVKVTSEVAPHHLLFSTDDYSQLGPYLKMNPPVRSPEEVARLVNFFGQGEIEVFATDHAPHTRAEKETKDYAKCPSGVPGVEYFLPLLLTAADLAGLSHDRAIATGSSTPANLFGFAKTGRLAKGYDANLVWVERGDFAVSGKEVLSKCGWTPYDGMRLGYQVKRTWHRGKMVYDGRDETN